MMPVSEIALREGLRTFGAKSLRRSRFQSEGKTDQAVGLIALGHIDAFDARVADSDQL
jgi:hypothetical protein